MRNFLITAIQWLFCSSACKWLFCHAMFAGTAFLTDPLYNEIDATNLESVRKNVVFDNLFVDTPFQQKLRAAGVLDPFLGGSGMFEGFIYGRVQGAAVAPGSSVAVTRQQLNTAMKFFPKAYVTWAPLDDWELDDGSGTGGVVNSGPAMIANQYQILMENMTMTLNTMIEMDSFRHGQSAGVGITDNRVLNTNGLDEALNNGIDPSVYGNIYSTFGGDTRNGVIGPALNSTPLWLGQTTSGASPTSLATNGTGQIDVNALTRLWAQCVVTGGQPDLGLTNVFGFTAVVNALDAQRRNTDMKKFDIAYSALTFNNMEIYADPLAPSALAGDFLSLAPTAGKAGNNNLVDGSGGSTQTSTIVTPQYLNTAGANVAQSLTGSNFPSNATCTVGEVLYFLETGSFKLRPTNKKGWNFGLRRSPMPNNVSMDAMFMRLGTNLYNVMPRHNAVAFGFSA
jgi:hypothetical protein